MSDVKQVIVVDKSLGMSKGKTGAQVAHASLKVFFDRISHSCDDEIIITGLNRDMLDWINGIFKKIVLSVSSSSELLDLFEKAQDLGLPCAIIYDNGLTEFNGVRTLTCVAIGPAKSSEIDVLTRHLTPYR